MITVFRNLQTLDREILRLQYVPVATLKIKFPSNFDDVEYPERSKLKVMEKFPPSDIYRRNKMQKMVHLMRGEEKVHNKLQYGQYGVQTLQGGRLQYEHFEHIRVFLNRKIDEKRMFALWRIEQPWQACTKKAVGVKMGGRKKNIHHYVSPFKPMRIIMEFGGHLEFEECEPWLSHIARILPAKARVVTKEILAKEAEKEKQWEEENINPFSFMYCAKHNFLGIKPHISRYEWMTGGKFR